MESLIKHINTLYNLKTHSLEKVTKGFLSENHILTDGTNKYFLKRYRFDNQDRIEEIHSAKKYFADGGIPVVLPLINNNSKTFFTSDGGFFALFPFIYDKQIEINELDEVATKSLGETLGKIHLLGKVSKLPIKERFKPWDKIEALEKIRKIEDKINALETLSDFDKLALENIKLKKDLILANTTTYEDLNLPSNHLIHGDYLYHNVFFNEINQVSQVFDFEKTDYSPRVYELFRSMMYSFLSQNTDQASLSKAKLYLDSYLNIYPTGKDELERGLELYYLKLIHGFWVESEHYLKDNTRTDHFLPLELVRLKFLSASMDPLKNLILEQLITHSSLLTFEGNKKADRD